MRRLLAHTIGGLDAFAARQPNPAAITELEDNVHAQFVSSAAAALATWAAPGALDGIVERTGRPPLPWSAFAGINFVDTFTHACDLAHATGQEAGIDEDLARECLEVARRVVPDDARPIVGFDPERTIDPSSLPSSQLAAFLGRSPI